ncbi:MAG TPA: gephyrin-like molybdotransferase Glp [Acidimicrobiales bacterium]|nr:gephyrin-like molybdotransferase Glp [Acidimicrobiales bacterium]
MIPLADAQARVLDRLHAATPVAVPIDEALHLVTASPVLSGEQVPPFDNSSVDGYALHAEETIAAPVRLRVVGTLAAGAEATHPIGPGEAIRIMTGAPVPEGTTGVVMVEDVEVDGDEVLVKVSVREGESVRRAGSDILVGAEVVPAATRLTPAHLGVLASIGHAEVQAHPRLTVGVLSTGDELVTDGSALGPGQVREANLDLLVGLLHEADCIPVNYGVVPDDETVITEALTEAAAHCDALITSGGVSMGDFDLIKVLLDKLGEMDWMQIAIRPAKPFAFGFLPGPRGKVPVFGLPGNPVSSLVSFELLARPGLRKMMGHRELFRPRILAIAEDRLARPRGDAKLHLIRVRGGFAGDGRLHVSATGEQGSHQLANSAAAVGLAVVEDGPDVEPGGEVPVLFFH